MNLAELQKEAPSPKEWERKMTVRPPNEHSTGSYYTVWEYRHCDCPECDVGLHWMGIMGTTNKEDAERCLRREY